MEGGSNILSARELFPEKSVLLPDCIFNCFLFGDWYWYFWTTHRTEALKLWNVRSYAFEQDPCRHCEDARQPFIIQWASVIKVVYRKGSSNLVFRYLLSSSRNPFFLLFFSSFFFTSIICTGRHSFHNFVNEVWAPFRSLTCCPQLVSGIYCVT